MIKDKLINSIVLIPLTFLISGCYSNQNTTYLSCNGFSNAINVYGENIEEKKEPLILPVQIKRLDTGFQRLLDNHPIYQIQVGNMIFENSHIFESNEVFIGRHERKTESNGNIYESRFHINRNTNHLIYYDFERIPTTKDRKNTQTTINFEGKCEKVKDKI